MSTTYNPNNLVTKRGHTLPITILTGQNLTLGSVLGKITKALGTTVVGGSNTGNGVMSGEALKSKSKIGNYVITCITEATNGGTFKVVDPDGIRLDDAVVGTVYANEFIGFSIADGTEDFDIGDVFTIPVVAGSGKYKLANKDSVDGSQEEDLVILEEANDASSADVVTAGIESGVVNENKLVFADGSDADDFRSLLRARGIFVRASQQY